MNPEQWQAVRELFLDASERDPEARARLLDEAGARDPEVAREASLLLEADESGPTRVENVPGLLGLQEALEVDTGPTPEHIGRYRVVGVLGDGRMGIVYRVKQENPEREVALKLLRSTMWSKGSLDRFRNEVRALSLLRHEHIARIYDAGTLPEPGGAARPYFVMELVEGKPITEFASSAAMDERRVIELFLQMCDGVEHAHMKGVIHRDLKPGNVLVDLPRDAEGTGGSGGSGQPNVKVIDFGIARILDSDERATLTGQVLGTPGYMSPEQFEGRSSTIDTRTDVFAAGAILRELLTGAANPSASREKGSNTKTARLAADLRLILETATAHDLERRYQSMAAFAADLRRYLSNRPIEARAPTVRYMASKFVGRNKALSAAIGLGLFAVAGMLMMQARTQSQLRAVSSVMLNQVAEILAGRIGASAERKSMLELLLPQIESFARSYPNDVAVQNDYAKILGAFGDTLEEEARFDEAMVYMERALAVRERLAARAPDDLKATSKLSIAVVRVGDLSEKVRTVHSQKGCYLRALAIDEAAARSNPTNPNVLSNLSFSYDRMAAHAFNRDLYGEATEYSQKEIATATRLLELEPQSTLAIWGMSSALATKAAILSRRGFGAERLEVAREEILLLRQLRQRSPDTKHGAKRLVECLIATAIKQAELDPGLLASSAEMAKEAVSVSRHLTTADPIEVEAALLHARAMCGLASALAGIGDVDGCDLALAEAQATADALAARCNDCGAGVLAQMTVLSQGVLVAIEMGDKERVREKARAALPRARQAATAFPSAESKRIVCLLLFAQPTMSEAEGEEAIGLARSLVQEDSRARVEHAGILIESLVLAGRQAEADEAMNELRRSIPATETKLLHKLEVEHAARKPKPRS